MSEQKCDIQQEDSKEICPSTYTVKTLSEAQEIIYQERLRNSPHLVLLPALRNLSANE